MLSKSDQKEKYQRLLAEHHGCTCLCICVNWHNVKVIDCDFDEPDSKLPRNYFRAIYFQCPCIDCDRDGVFALSFPCRDTFGLNNLVSAIHFALKTVSEGMTNTTGRISYVRLREIRRQVRACWLMYHQDYGSAFK